ncbi:alkaline phosphatase [soil metagenome]|nr:alkaline phosphatase family protein [Gemmatimonadota bacterium]
MLLFLSGCRAPAPPAAPQAHVAARVAASAPVRHVIIVSIDGLRPDAIDRAPAPTLQRLMREGAFSLRAETILPSKTLPSHVSMLTGVSPETHGITWNTDRTRQYGAVRVPTVFELAEQAGLRTALFLGKRKLRHLVREGTGDWVSYPRTDVILTADQVAGEVVEYLAFEQPNLVFVHIPDPDLAGHTVGWMSAPYRWAVRRADRAVAHIHAAAIRAYGEDFVLIVTSDHGGEGRTHGRTQASDILIPWIVWGKGISTGEITGEIRTFDTGATALWLLGIDPPRNWDGEPVRSVLHSVSPATGEER